MEDASGYFQVRSGVVLSAISEQKGLLNEGLPGVLRNRANLNRGTKTKYFREHETFLGITGTKNWRERQKKCRKDLKGTYCATMSLPPCRQWLFFHCSQGFPAVVNLRYGYEILKVLFPQLF